MEIKTMKAETLKEWINSLDDNCEISFYHYYSRERLVPESMHEVKDDRTVATILMIPTD